LLELEALASGNQLKIFVTFLEKGHTKNFSIRHDPHTLSTFGTRYDHFVRESD
jgi:hypothetical protein